MAMRPVPEMYPVTQTYWGTFSTQFSGGARHGAIDYGAPLGTPVVAPDDGVIAFKGWASDLPAESWEARDYMLRPSQAQRESVGGGLMVRINLPDGGRWWAAHLNETLVDVGQRVRKGDVIGRVGTTGSSTGYHLHKARFPTRPNWNNGAWGAIDPAPLLTERFRSNQATSWSGSATGATGATTSTKLVLTGPKTWIDVSDYQPTTVIRDVQTDAVVIKASEGASWRSERIAGHITAAQAKGVPFGLYHFARANTNDAITEAKHFLSVARPYLNDVDHLCLDFEENNLETWAGRQAWVEAFLRHLAANAPGVRRTIYTRAGFLAGDWSGFVRGHTVWIAAYGTDQQQNGYRTTTTGAPTVPGFTVGAWQYSQRGRLPGYGADLDLNISLPTPVGLNYWKDNGIMAISDADADKIVDRLLGRKLPKRGLENYDMTVGESLAWQGDSRNKINILHRIFGRGLTEPLRETKLRGINGAVGDMDVITHLEHDRPERLRSQRIEAKLDALATALATETTDKHTKEG